MTDSTPDAPHLTATQHRAMEALARCLVVGAPASSETLTALVARCDARLGALPPHRRAAFRTALTAMVRGATTE